MRCIRNIVLGIGVLFIAYSTKAQDSSAHPMPVLNEHTFVGVSYNSSPFTNTFFRTFVGVGSTSNFDFPVVDIDGESLVGFKGKLLFSNLGMEYTQNIHDWIAVYLKLSLTARIGTNASSLVSQGINTVSGFESGWIIRLSQGRKHQLSTSLSMHNYNGNFINIGQFLRDYVNGNPNASITEKVPSLSAGFGLRYGYAFNSVFGVLATGNALLGESFSREGSDFRYTLGASFEANFYKAHRVPLGIILGYNLNTRPDVVYIEGRSVSVITSKIAYTGRQDFLLAIELNSLKLPVDEVSEKPVINQFQLNMSYFFGKNKH